MSTDDENSSSHLLQQRLLPPHTTPTAGGGQSGDSYCSLRLPPPLSSNGVGSRDVSSLGPSGCAGDKSDDVSGVCGSCGLKNLSTQKSCCEHAAGPGTPGGVNNNPDQCYSWLHALRGGRVKKNSESSSDASSSSGSLPMPPSPDGGWGWFVVLGAFLVSVICDGLSYCFGLLYSELKVQFGASRSMTSAVGSIFFGVSMILGPLASSLTTRFGCRKMTIFGGILAFLGFLSSSFTNSIEMLCVTFGVIVGAGFSFCYITSVVIVAFYFEKRRALATGLAVCGTGIGTFTFAPLIDFLIYEYGWRGLFLILSGISLNLLVCGMLFRPLKFTDVERWQLMLEEFNRIPHGREEIEVVRSRYPSESSDSDSDAESSDEDTKALSTLNLPTFVATSNLEVSQALLMEAIKNSKNPHRTMQRYMKNAMMRSEQECKIGRPDQVPLVKGDNCIIRAMSPTDVGSDTENALDSLPSSLVDDTNILRSCKPPQICGSDAQKEANNKLAVSRSNVFQTDSISKSGEPVHLFIVDQFGRTCPIYNSQDLRKKDTQKRHELHGLGSTLTGKIHANESRMLSRRMSGMYMGRHNALGIHLPLYRSDIFYRRLQRQNNPLRHCTLGTSCPEFTDTSSVESDHGYVYEMIASLLEEICDVLKSMVDVQLLSNPFFSILIISNFLFYLWSDVPYMYAADHAMENGVDPQKASFLLSIVGIFNTIGQVVFGYIGDLECNLLNVYAIVSVLAGGCISLIPLMPTFWSTCVLYALFGFFVSVSFPLTTVLLVKYLGVEKLTSAYGLLMLMQGIANLFGPPFAGWVSDETGNYNAAFYLSGLFYALSGFTLFLVYIPKLRVEPAPRRKSLTISSDAEQV
ncbi:monocarboxylate transporter 12 [Aplysia californica]|uniref:Monocarboxylate transporter 12 n=1 Tax=Aplysia californica TaxID=6500 RepID=A0ABM0JTC2_APLCA|nr:monocarboxylate transporter 12 [Aplysia californica]